MWEVGTAANTDVGPYPRDVRLEAVTRCSRSLLPDEQSEVAAVRAPENRADVEQAARTETERGGSVRDGVGCHCSPGGRGIALVQPLIID